MTNPYAMCASVILAMLGAAAVLVSAAAVVEFLIQAKASYVLAVAALFSVLGVGSFLVVAAVLKFSDRTWFWKKA